MKTIVKKTMTRDNVNKFSNKLSKLFQEIADELLIELTLASKDKLNKTLYGTYPRGQRSDLKQKGFDNANVSIINSQIIESNKGARVLLTIRVTEGNSNNPHKIWHLINKGFQSSPSSNNRRFPVRRNTRTNPNNLNSSSFGGYTGEWRTIKAGEMPSPVAPRNWYKTALDEIDKDIIEKYGMIFDFKRKEANDG